MSIPTTPPKRPPEPLSPLERAMYNDVQMEEVKKSSQAVQSIAQFILRKSPTPGPTKSKMTFEGLLTNRKDLIAALNNEKNNNCEFSVGIIGTPEGNNATYFVTISSESSSRASPDNESQ